MRTQILDVVGLALETYPYNKLRESLHKSHFGMTNASDWRHHSAMKKASPGLKLAVKQARKQVFLDQMDRVVPWSALVELIAPY